MVLKIIGGNGGVGGCYGGGTLYSPSYTGAMGILDISNLEQSGFFPENKTNLYSNQKQTIIRY